MDALELKGVNGGILFLKIMGKGKPLRWYTRIKILEKMI